jgi:hypothetical protein
MSADTRPHLSGLLLVTDTRIERCYVVFADTRAAAVHAVAIHTGRACIGDIYLGDRDWEAGLDVRSFAGPRVIAEYDEATVDADGAAYGDVLPAVPS